MLDFCGCRISWSFRPNVFLSLRVLSGFQQILPMSSRYKWKCGEKLNTEHRNSQGWSTLTKPEKIRFEYIPCFNNRAHSEIIFQKHTQAIPGHPIISTSALLRSAWLQPGFEESMGQGSAIWSLSKNMATMGKQWSQIIPKDPRFKATPRIQELTLKGQIHQLSAWPSWKLLSTKVLTY